MKPATVIVGGRTARELLVHIGGEDHVLHSVAGRGKPFSGEMKVVCSCGEPFYIAATQENITALRNAPELKNK